VDSLTPGLPLRPALLFGEALTRVQWPAGPTRFRLRCSHQLPSVAVLGGLAGNPPVSTALEVRAIAFMAPMQIAELGIAAIDHGLAHGQGSFSVQSLRPPSRRTVREADRPALGRRTLGEPREVVVISCHSAAKGANL